MPVRHFGGILPANQIIGVQFARTNFIPRTLYMNGNFFARPVCGLALTVLFAICGFAQTKPAADLIVTRAKVWTVDATRPQAEAVAVIGERIVAVGSHAEVEQWRGPQTRVIDAGGKLVLPGFNDAHVHFISGGMELDSVQLKDATSAQEFARLIGEKAKSMPKGEWILEGNWDETKW